LLISWSFFFAEGFLEIFLNNPLILFLPPRDKLGTPLLGVGKKPLSPIVIRFGGVLLGGGGVYPLGGGGGFPWGGTGGVACGGGGVFWVFWLLGGGGFLTPGGGLGGGFFWGVLGGSRWGGGFFFGWGGGVGGGGGFFLGGVACFLLNEMFLPHKKNSKGSVLLRYSVSSSSFSTKFFPLL